MKTRQDNDVIDHTDVAYDENETELLWSIGLGAYVMKTRQDNDMIDCKVAVYDGNDIEQLGSIRPGVVFDENQTRQGHNQSSRCGLCQKIILNN